jgi:hypothetical protein
MESKGKYLARELLRNPIIACSFLPHLGMNDPVKQLLIFAQTDSCSTSHFALKNLLLFFANHCQVQ